MRPTTLIVASFSISFATALVTGSLQCTSQCTDQATLSQSCVAQDANSTDPGNCTCSNEFINALQGCYQCLVSNSAMTEEAANGALSSLAAACASSGQAISTPTVSDNSASAPVSSSGAPKETTPPTPKNSSAERFTLGSSLLGVSALVGLGSMILLV